jgi:hypothetical protein
MFGSIISAIFGKNGIAGGVVSVLQDVGILKDPVEEEKAREALMKFELEARSQETEILNEQQKSIQAEISSGKWYLQWHAVLGWIVCLMIANNYVLVTWFPLKPVVIPTDIWSLIMVLLGIKTGADWHISQKRIGLHHEKV